MVKLKNSNKKFKLSRYYRTLQYFKSRYLVEFFYTLKQLSYT